MAWDRLHSVKIHKRENQENVLEGCGQLVGASWEEMEHVQQESLLQDL